MADYSKGLIYTIKTNDGLYVGSTCDFNKRKIHHKCCIYNEKDIHYNLNLYKNIRENDGEYSIELYKLFPCNNRRELEQEEDKIMLELNANLNEIRAYRTEEEKKEYEKKYHEKNREQIKQKQKEKIKCECGCDVSRRHIQRHRRTEKHLNRMKVLDSLN